MGHIQKRSAPECPVECGGGGGVFNACPDCLGYFFREEFKGIYKGEFSQIDFRHRHDQVVKRIREDWGQTQLSEELLRRIDGILDVNSVEHRVGT